MDPARKLSFAAALALSLFGLWADGVANARAGGAAFKGPVAATVERVIDGDTIEVKAQIWIDQELRVAVRLAGVDAPERPGGRFLMRSPSVSSRPLQAPTSLMSSRVC